MSASVQSTAPPRRAFGVRRADDHPDQGAVSVFLVMATTILVIFVGIAVDLSGTLHSMQYAQDVARQAARAAAQAPDAGSVVRGESATLDTARAAQAGQQFLDAAGVQGTVTVNGDQVTVETTTTYEPVILSLAGIGTKTVTGHSTAQLNRVSQGVAR